MQLFFCILVLSTISLYCYVGSKINFFLLNKKYIGFTRSLVLWLEKIKSKTTWVDVNQPVELVNRFMK
jgi:capsular polysaccharide biosynthesis protein